MSPTRIACLLLLACSSRVLADLQLKPRLSSYELDGSKFSQLAFSDGEKEVTYTPPAGWDYSGNTTSLALHPKDKAQAEATVSRAPVAEPMTLDEPGMKKLVAAALATVPGDSTNVQVVSQEVSPVFIDKKETFRVTISYALYGQSYGRSVLFMDRGKEEFRFQLVCHLDDFKDLQLAFQQSLFSWQNL